MKVRELIEFLQTQPQDIQVAIQMYSEYCLLDVKAIKIIEEMPQRADGWIHEHRPDMPVQQYLLFPGN